MRRYALFGGVILFILATAVPVFGVGKSTQYWTVSTDVLNFGSLNADGNPTFIGALADTTCRWGTTALTADDGTMLFAGNGMHIYYKGLTDAHRISPTSGLDCDGNLVQAAVILPYPGEPGSYAQVYVRKVFRTLSMVKLTPEAETKISASTSVVGSSQRIKALTVVERPAKDGYWIISYVESGPRQFEVYSFTSAGMQKSPDTGPALLSDRKMLDYSNFKASTDGTKVAYVAGSPNPSSPGRALKAYVVTYPFNPSDGSIGSASKEYKLSDALPGFLGGCEFSPNGKYVYAATQYLGVLQVDSATGNVVRVDDPMTPGSGSAVGGFQLAMNGRIYGTYASAKKLVVIRNPNEPGGGPGGCTVTFDEVLNADAVVPGLPIFVQTDLFDAGVEAEVVAGTRRVKGTRTGTTVPDAWGLCWGAVENPTVAGTKAAAPAAGDITFEKDLSGEFGGGDTLYARAWSTTGATTVYSRNVKLTKPSVSMLFETRSAVPKKSTAEFVFHIRDAGGTISERGVCLSESANPAVSDMFFKSGSGAGDYSVTATGLTPGTTYHYRAVAKFTHGYGYGNDGELKTKGSTVEYEGTLVASDGITPVAGAVVSTRLYRDRNGKPASATTNALGRFKMPAIPDNVLGLTFVAGADNYLALEFTPAKLAPGNPLVMQSAGVTIDLNVEADSGTLPEAVYARIGYRDGTMEPVVTMTPSAGRASASLGGKNVPFDVYVEAEGFEGRKIDKNAVPDPVRLKAVASDAAASLKTADPTVSGGTVTFTVTQASPPPAACTAADYDVEAFEAVTHRPLTVEKHQDSPDAFRVECTGSPAPSKGVMLRITDGADNCVLVETWLAPQDLQGKVAETGRKVSPVNPSAGGQLTQPVAGAPSGVTAGLPPGGLDEDVLRDGCVPDPTAYLEITVHKLGNDAGDKPLERTSGSFTSLAEVNLNLFNCHGPVDPNKGALREMLITIPYDTAAVTVEELLAGSVRVYHAPDLGDFHSLQNLMLVPTADIQSVNPVEGTITVRVTHLSVFGVGTAASLVVPGGGGGDSGGGTGGGGGSGTDSVPASRITDSTPVSSGSSSGGCVIGTDSDACLALLALIAAIALPFRMRRRPDE